MAVKSLKKPGPIAAWVLLVPIMVLTPWRSIDLTGVITAAVPQAAISSKRFSRTSVNGITRFSTDHPKDFASWTKDCFVTEFKIEGDSGAQKVGISSEG